MAIEKLESVKFANSIRLNLVENHYFSDKRTHISLDGIVIRLEDINSKDVTYSSLMNVISFTKYEDLQPKKASK
jgi:hypothetical protein